VILNKILEFGEFLLAKMNFDLKALAEFLIKICDKGLSLASKAALMKLRFVLKYQ